MAAAIIMLAFIALFVGTIVLIKFPAVATEIYDIISLVIDYIGKGTGILWFFVPRQLALTIVTLVLAIEVIYRGFLLFLWIYNHLKQ